MLKMNNKIISPLLIVAAMVSSFVYYSFLSQNSIEQSIIKQENYELELIKDDVSINFDYKPEWLKQELDKPKTLMQKISQTGDSEVYIEEVVRQETRICISLLIKPKYKFRQGNFLFVDNINANGTITNSHGQWIVLKNGKELDPLRYTFGNGTGPGNRVAIFLDLDRIKDFDSSFQLMFRGLKKYAYKRI